MAVRLWWRSRRAEGRAKGVSFERMIGGCDATTGDATKKIPRHAGQVQRQPAAIIECGPGDLSKDRELGHGLPLGGSFRRGV
ncbi:hypothetical protein [Lacipirellula sp.]|uniref:hypothetical protein n=1 Tax=Lacipirellula sp. TaxID=2691419 RepID=UPI003D0FC9FB